MILDQRFFRILDRAFDSPQLLRKLHAWFAALDHFNGSFAGVRRRA
jgi:hypothetical protein